MSPDHWVYLPSKELIGIHRISEFKNFSDESRPRATRRWSAARSPAAPGTATWQLELEEAGALADARPRESIGLLRPKGEQPARSTIARLPQYAYPVYDLTYRSEPADPA